MPDIFIKELLIKEESASSRTTVNESIGSNDHNHENTSKEAVYGELVAAGFSCIDNRTSSNIIWVLYQADKEGMFEMIANKYGVQYKLEKRGAMATNGRAAWRIMN